MSLRGIILLADIAGRCHEATELDTETGKVGRRIKKIALMKRTGGQPANNAGSYCGRPEVSFLSFFRPESEYVFPDRFSLHSADIFSPEFRLICSRVQIFRIQFSGSQFRQSIFEGPCTGSFK
jgi:hypothetical protein